MKTYYHGSEYPIKELRSQPMFFTDSEEFAKSLEWNGLENEKCNRYVYSAKLEYTKPFIITSEEEYEERMMDMPCFENDEDALIYPAEGKTPEYIVVKDAAEQVKNFKLVKHVFENINERLEQLIDEEIFITNSAYDVKNLLQNKPKEYRVIYDSWIKTYIIADSHKYIHEDMIKKAYEQGCYAECPKMDEYFRSPLTVTDYLAERFEDETFLRLLFVPKGEPAFLGSDDYDFAYTYSFGTILSREGYWENSDLFEILGEPCSTESSFDESINERLEKLSNCFITSSPYDIVNLFKNKPKEYRVLYDKNIDMYMIGEADSVTHYDMINRAMKDAYYYNMEDFIEEIGGTVDNYTELGQSGFWDGDTEEENFDAYLWYIVFSPNEEWTLGTDGYDKRYDYPFGHVFTRGCDLDEISLWEALGVPQETEKLNEDTLKGYRYVLTCDGEYQGVGMFHGLSEVDRDEDYIEHLEDMFKELNIPQSVFNKNRITTSYFTEKGLKKFKKAIEVLKQAYEDYSLYSIEIVTDEINPDEIVYQDDYQIIVKGKKEVKLNESKETNLNAAFWKWFGNSKLIKNGKPLVFYHRTNAVFDTFDKAFGSPLLADGFYFSDKPLSEWYGKNIMEVYLKMEKPYIIEDMQNIDDVAKFVEEFNLLSEDIKATLQNYSNEFRSNKDRAFDGKAALRRVIKWHLNDQTKYVTERLQKKNYDGLIIKNSDGQDDIKYDEYIVFKPNQIKSIDNHGEWSNSNNIYETLNKEIERYL